MLCEIIIPVSGDTMFKNNPILRWYYVNELLHPEQYYVEESIRPLTILCQRIILLSRDAIILYVRITPALGGTISKNYSIDV